MSETTLLPVGTILPYACGDLPGLDGSWLACDGAAYGRDDRAELFAAIGTAYGAPGPQQFNVPDLRGLFVRGCDDGSGRDSRVARRSALLAGGHTGGAVGSYQVYGTAPAHTPFRATFPNCNLSEVTDDMGCKEPPGAWTDQRITISPYRGGDLESRPPNIYANWIIKASAKNAGGTGYATVPVAAVLAYAGNDPGQVDATTWLLCDGAPLAIAGPYGALAVALNKAYGSPDASRMCLPDLRGRFIRGVDLSQRRDPDAGRRTAPYPQAGSQGFAGNTGDAIGSVQSTATALPTQAPFFSALDSVPYIDGARTVPGGTSRLAKAWRTRMDVSISAGGGDNETRPRNMAVDWFVAGSAPDGSDPDDRVPVGAVVAVGRQTLDGDDFLPCNGQALPKDQHGELYAKIGTLYGGDAAGAFFNVPDCRGVFLRGADHGANVDPDAAARVFSPSATPPPTVGTAGSYQDYATRIPDNPFIAQVPRITPLDAGGGKYGGQARINGDLATTTCTEGGDGDTAPANVYVQYFIKARG